MSNADDKLFYVGQKAFIDKDGDILILNDPDLGIDFPGGKIQEGEDDFVEALKREVREETRLEIEVGTPFMTWFRNVNKPIYLVGYRCKFVSGDVVISDEHNDFKWVNKDNYIDLPRGGYYEILEKFFKGA